MAYKNKKKNKQHQKEVRKANRRNNLQYRMRNKLEKSDYPDEFKRIAREMGITL